MITIGHDAELFLAKEGKYVSAIPVLKGTKDKPEDVIGGALHSDNVLAELNIEPASTQQEFIHNTHVVMGELRKRTAGLTLEVDSSHKFSRKELKSFGAGAFEFGCNPDFNCWKGGEENVPPSPYTELRTAGGHIHIGFDHGSTEDQLNAAQMCEYLLGLPSIILDQDQVRRELYGQSGAFRFKPYGIEYRVLSNFWLKSDELMGWAYDQAHTCITDLSKLSQYKKVLPPAKLQEIINKGLVEEAKAYAKELKVSCL